MSCVYLVVPVTYGSSLPTGCESASSRDEVKCAFFSLSLSSKRDKKSVQRYDRDFSARRYAMSLTTVRARETESTESREIADPHTAHTHPPSMQPDSLSHTHTRARARATAHVCTGTTCTLIRIVPPPLLLLLLVLPALLLLLVRLLLLLGPLALLGATRLALVAAAVVRLG